jgi:polyhydroxyalkanoate synthesis regulator phasin
VSRLWKIAGITALVAVLAVSAVAIVSAQGPQAGQGNQGLNLWERMHGAIAKALGISVEQYDSAVDTARDDVLKQAVGEGVLTQEQADRIRGLDLDGFGPWGMMRGGVFGGRGVGAMGGPGKSLVATAADELGMTVQQLVDELEAGKTIADVAKANGVELKTIVDAFVAPRSEYLAELVADGRISQEQADAMLAHMREEAEQHLQEAYPFSCDGECGEHMSEGPGGYGRWGGTSGSVVPDRFQGMMGRRTF